MSTILEQAERADVMTVTDEPHDWYVPYRHDEELSVPQVYDGKRGMVLLKDIEYSTIDCPECGTVARKDDRGTPVCPDCGALCTPPERPEYEVVIDEKTTERVDSDGNYIT